MNETDLMMVRIEPKAEPIPGYRLIERLGGGGFGEVWKAEAPGGLLKAIKFVFGDLKAAGEENQRAEQELKALARVRSVRHPYILSLERYDVIDGQLLIVMELADRNLWDRFKECRAQGLEGIPRDELLRYMQESAEALDLMNQQYQLQHLDIKPQNIFLTGDHIKVADFGLAKDLEGSHASVTGGVTPVYAAPETFDGVVSRFCDQYSLAIVYQELLTGRRPFNGTNVRQLILQHLQAVPDVSPLLPADQPVIARALSKRPNDRFPSCQEMVRLLWENSRPSGIAPVLPAAQFSPSNGLSAPPRAEASQGSVADKETPPSHLTRVSGGGSPFTKVGGPQAERIDLEGPETPNLHAPTPALDEGTRTTQIVRGGASVPRVIDQLLAAEPFREIKGDGVLFPALVLAVGQTGVTVLHRLREILVDRHGSLAQLPNLRMLLLDSDPEAGRQAMRSPSPGALNSNEVLFAGLNRPSYYLKPRDGKPLLNTWLNPRMLFRIPRSQVTTGVRALGRLAFLDNFRVIQRRLKAELEPLLDFNTLTRAVQKTGLGLRSNRPRVYILCSLGGGTGSGMFLDLAYTVRALLKKMGLDQPDVVGLFLLPPAEGQQSRELALGNAHAALTELNYFGKPGAQFRAQYVDREAPLEDSEPPFSRYFLLTLPDETDEAATHELVDMAGQFLYRDLCTPLGQAADLARAELPAPPWAARGQYYQTFGLYQLSSPRQSLCRRVAQQLGQKLVQRWLSRDSKPLRDAVGDLIQDQWTKLGLGAEPFISRLRDFCQQRLAQPPETLFYNLIEPLIRKVAVSPASLRRGAAAVDLTAEEVTAVLQQIEAEVGRPKDEVVPEVPGRVIAILREGAEAANHEVTQRVAELAVQLIEDPSFRLAGAEEAIRRLVSQVEQVLQHHEPLTRELTANAEQQHARLEALCAPAKPGQRRSSVPARDAVELLRNYAKSRFQCQLLHQVAGAFLSLRGQLSDQLREINFCRNRLSELLRQLENGKVREPQVSIGKQLFAFGCSSQDDAVQYFLSRITGEAIQELDFRMQEMIRSKFKALVDICMGSANVLRNVEQEMLATCQQFAEEMLEVADVAQMFLEREPGPEQRINELQDYYQEALPELTPAKHVQPMTLTVLATPASEAGEALQELARQALPDVEIHPVASTDDVVIYREIANLPLSSLPHLGPAVGLIYRQMTGTENYTPHTRIDIDFGKASLPT